MKYPTIEDAVGNTPLVALQRIGAQDNAARGNVVLGKLEGNNPAGSVKDRPALSMIRRAEERGDIRPGDTLIEATSGNTGIALAMAAAIAKAMPVLPDVASISVSPGRISPRSSARRIIDSAGRSLTDPAGLLPSSLPSTTLPRAALSWAPMRCSATSGVLPTASSIVGYFIRPTVP